MNGIMGMTAMALRKATDPKQMDQLAKATQSGEKLLALINDILEFSKADAESFALDVAPFILADVLESVTSQDGQKASDKGLAFHVEIDSDLASRPLMGDRPRLEHILLALTGNAIKFTSQGSVTVRVQATEDNPQDLLLRFEVQDTGIGISAEDQSRLFTAFQQVDGSMTRKYGGSGLGLALSQRLARAMGGDMGVDSQIGAGSTFWLTVRLGKSASAVPPAAA
jgi:signal transduction histidine kinase